jgi:hypothetical protein
MAAYGRRIALRVCVNVETASRCEPSAAGVIMCRVVLRSEVPEPGDSCARLLNVPDGNALGDIGNHRDGSLTSQPSKSQRVVSHTTISAR